MSSLDLLCDKASIIVTVYDRYNHIRECLESLEAAKGSENYHVIVGSDSPYTENHIEKISTVREYLLEKEKSHGFKKFTVIYHEKNIGPDENFDACIALSKSFEHKSFIMMEDDVIVGSYFLEFISDGLSKFERDESVIAINGYLDPNLINKSSVSFLYNRFSAYGFASWHKKWDRLQERRMSVNYASKVLSDINLFKKIVKISHQAKSYPFLAENFYKAADIEIGLMMEIEKLWILAPAVSLTANRGMDGSGLRSGVNDDLQSMQPYNEKIHVPDPSNIARYRLEEIKKHIPLEYILQGWISFIIYKYIPFGFQILKHLRVIKKSL